MWHLGQGSVVALAVLEVIGLSFKGVFQPKQFQEIGSSGIPWNKFLCGKFWRQNFGSRGSLNMGFMELNGIKVGMWLSLFCSTFEGSRGFFLLYKVKEKMKQLFKTISALFELPCLGPLSITPGSSLPAPTLI